jgi:alpha-L-fucosidase
MSYQPTWESVSQHPVPGWFDDAKLGIFLHWGLYSVPGWAPQVPDIQQMLREQGPNGMLRNNPYAEWYLNTMRIQGSPTWEHHRQTYGPDFRTTASCPSSTSTPRRRISTLWPGSVFPPGRNTWC